MNDKPWWWPELIDAAYFARLRADYPKKAEWTDEELHNHFAEGRKYAITWDHIGDAYAEYEELVDAFFANPLEHRRELLEADGEPCKYCHDSLARIARLEQENEELFEAGKDLGYENAKLQAAGAHLEQENEQLKKQILRDGKTISTLEHAERQLAEAREENERLRTTESHAISEIEVLERQLAEARELIIQAVDYTTYTPLEKPITAWLAANPEGTNES